MNHPIQAARTGPWRPSRIISGGQTGVDRAALDWAIAHGIDHGGWCPHGRASESGPIPSRYRLQETPAAGYSQRTRLNVQAAEGTLIICRGPLVGGSRLTLRFARELARPACVLDLEEDRVVRRARFLAWRGAHAIGTLNVAGPSESRCPGIHCEAMDLLDHLFGKD